MIPKLIDLLYNKPAVLIDIAFGCLHGVRGDETFYTY